MIPVTVDEVLCHFSARTNAPSSMGSQLDRLALQSDAKRHGPGWTTHAKPTKPTPADPDGAIMRHASIYRVMEDLARLRAVDLDTTPRLAELALTVQATIGQIVVKTLRAFQESLTAPSDEDLARASARASKAEPRPDEPPSVFADRQSGIVQKAIAEYRAPKGVEAVRKAWGLKTTGDAAELYGDCFLVVSLYVQQFNRRKGAAV